MLVGVFTPGQKDDPDRERVDFGYIRDEIKNIKDVPRKFDEELYRSTGVSDTVISYWKKIGFTPGYFQSFTLIENCRYKYTYDEYRKKCQK